MVTMVALSHQYVVGGMAMVAYRTYGTALKSYINTWISADVHSEHVVLSYNIIILSTPTSSPLPMYKW